MIFGLFAWWLYEVDGPERSLLRAHGGFGA